MVNCLIMYAELGAASVVDPEAAVVDAPGLAEGAGRAADLTVEGNVAATSDVTPVSFAVVGGAGDGLTLLSWPPLVSVASGGELGAASLIDPETSVVVAPGLALDAWAAADLSGELNAAASVDIAVVTLPVIGGAGDGLALLAWVAGAVTSGGELGAASLIDPEALVVVAPGLALDAWAAADLAGELDAAAGVDIAVVALSVI